MNQNKAVSIASRSLASVLLLLALLKLPYGYYTLLRLAVCVVAAYHCVLSYKLNRGVLTVLFGFVAILFNPIIPILLERDTWQIIDVVVSLLFLLSLFLVRSKAEA